MRSMCSITSCNQAVQRQTQRLRRQLFLDLTAQGQKLLKGIRWLLVKNRENLDPSKKETAAPGACLACERTVGARLLHEGRSPANLDAGEQGHGAPFLRDWIARARVSGIRMLEQFRRHSRRTPRGHLELLRLPISTGPLEGTNNKIQLMKRQAYGYRDHEFFKLKIMGAHET